MDQATRPGFWPVSGMFLSEEIFQLNLCVGLLVAVFYYDRSVERNPPLFTRPTGHGSRARHNHGLFGNHQRFIISGAIDGAPDEVVDGSGAIQNGSRTEHGAALDHRTFVHTAIAADQHFVLDDHGKRTDRFEYAANL